MKMLKLTPFFKRHLLLLPLVLIAASALAAEYRAGRTFRGELLCFRSAGGKVFGNAVRDELCLHSFKITYHPRVGGNVCFMADKYGQIYGNAVNDDCCHDEDSCK